MKQKRRRTVRAMICSVMAVLLMVWLLTPPDRNLFKRARMVEPRKDFIYPAILGRTQPPLRLQCDWPYCWIKPQLLLTVRLGKGSIWSLDPKIVDLKSGRHLPVSQFKNLSNMHDSSLTLSTGRPPRLGVALSCQASPDGAYLLIARNQAYRPGSYGPLVVTAVRTDDSSRIDWPVPEGIDSEVWLRDSRGWAGVVPERAGYKIAVFDAARSESMAAYPFDVDGKSDWPFNQSSLHPVTPVLAGTLDDGRLLAINWSAPVKGQVLAARFLPGAEAAHPRKQVIPVPAGTAAEPILPPVLSPTDNRLAWFVAVRRVPLGWPATQRFWSLWKTRPSEQIGLWTTRSDGSDAREIGVYTQTDADDHPSQLQWTPDGRSLSFRYDGALYTIPAL
jgi:hypothetical protein